MRAYWAGDALFRNPITGIVGCARAVSGHATTAPPMNLMNFRRRMCPP
jgi:hypothetical protein